MRESDWYSDILSFFSSILVERIIRHINSKMQFCIRVIEKILCKSASSKIVSKQVFILLSIAKVHTSFCDICSKRELSFELNAMIETGADAVVWVSNRLDLHNEGDATWLRNAEKLLSKLPTNAMFGMYECPVPYKRLLSKEILDWCKDTKRFLFIKDTCCDPNLLCERLKQLENSNIGLFNANSQTLLHSLNHGAAGFSGIMANFHPSLYVWLCREFNSHPETAEHLQQLITMCAFASMSYPVTAKYYLSKSDIPMDLHTRTRSETELNSYQKIVLDQMRNLTDRVYESIKAL